MFVVGDCSEDNAQCQPRHCVSMPCGATDTYILPGATQYMVTIIIRSNNQRLQWHYSLVFNGFTYIMDHIICVNIRAVYIHTAAIDFP